MKKKKLKLKSLQVQSFVTSADSSLVKGGGPLDCLNSDYPTMPCNCSAVDACVTAWNCTPYSQTCLETAMVCQVTGITNVVIASVGLCR